MRGARTDASLPRYGVWSIARVTGGYRYEMADPHTMNGSCLLGRAVGARGGRRSRPCPGYPDAGAPCPVSRCVMPSALIFSADANAWAGSCDKRGSGGRTRPCLSVSYTHLTLPTIYSV